MFLAMINKPKQLLYLSLIERVRADEMARALENVAELLTEMAPGFTVITDMSAVESIGVGAEQEIGKLMEMCDRKDVGLVLRVIPDPSKDIGFNIIALFHYRRPRRSVTCSSMVEAAKYLPT